MEHIERACFFTEGGKCYLTDFYGMLPLIYIGDSTVDRDHCASVGMDLIAFRNPELEAAYHVESFMDIFRLPPFVSFSPHPLKNRTVKLNPRRVSRYYYLRFIRLQGTPYSLAMGSALGASIAVTPTLPLHTICIIGVTLLLRVSTIAGLMAGTVISNPLTFAAQYYLSWKVGNMILPGRLDWNQLHELLLLVRDASFFEGIKIMGRLGFDAMLVLQTGGLALAVPLGIITYFSAIRLFVHLQMKKQRKHLLNT